MNDKLKFKLMKADPEFVRKLRLTALKRAIKFPEEKIGVDLTDRELTRMMKNTTNFEESLKELETLPRKRIGEWN